MSNGASYTELCVACSNQTQTARVYPNADSSPCKDEDLTRGRFNVGPAPLAVGQFLRKHNFYENFKMGSGIERGFIFLFLCIFIFL